MNEADTRYHLIDPQLRAKGYVNRDHITLETILTPAAVEPSGTKGRRRKGPGRTDYLLCVQVGDMPKPLPVAVLEAKREGEDPLKGMQQALVLRIQAAMAEVDAIETSAKAALADIECLPSRVLAQAFNPPGNHHDQ